MGPGNAAFQERYNFQGLVCGYQAPRVIQQNGAHSAPDLVKNMRSSPIMPQSKGCGPQLWFHVRLKLNYTHRVSGDEIQILLYF